MWYVIFAQDVDNSLSKRMEVRPQHLERLELLANQDRLLVAGPNPAIDSETPDHTGFTGSTVIAWFDSLQEATKWANEDPYVTAGVYENVIVKPLKKVLP